MMDYYKNIIGYENIKQELKTLADYIKNREYYSQFNTKPQTNILLYGRPGTGKSSLAMAFVKSTGLPHYLVRKTSSKKEFAEELKNTVDTAIEKAPCVIVLDDMDKYLSDEYSDEYNYVQAHIDNIANSNKEVYIIATSNDISMMPDSLERRFNMLAVDSPSIEDTEKIVKYYIGQKGFVADNINYNDVVRLFAFDSCAHIESVISEAAVHAAQQRKNTVDMNDLLTIFLAHKKINKENTEDSENDDDLWQICIHEAGHIIGLLAHDKHDVEGFAYAVADHKKDSEARGLVARYYPHSSRESHIIELLAAPMAVSEFFGRPDIGGEKDYDTAIDIVFEQACVVDSGMRGVRPERNSKNSDIYQNTVETVVHHELERYKWVARELVHKNRDLVEELAKVLYAKNYLLYSDVKAIFKKYEILK